MKEFEFTRGNRTVKCKAELSTDDDYPEAARTIVIDSANCYLLNEMFYREGIISEREYKEMRIGILAEKEKNLKALLKQYEKQAKKR